MSDTVDIEAMTAEQLRRHVAGLTADRDSYKRVAEARVVNVAVNGKSPLHWSPDRWISLASLAMVGSMCTWTLNVYSEYRSTLQTVKVLAESAPVVTRSVSDLATSIAVLHVTVDGMDRRLSRVEGIPPAAARPMVAPTFPRESQFSPAAAERTTP